MGNILRMLTELKEEDDHSVDEMEKKEDDCLLELMKDYSNRDLSMLTQKEGGTMEIYIQKLKQRGFPWLKAK